MNDHTRVAMVIQAYHPRIGGAERLVATLSPLLQAQGVEVHVLTRRYPGLARFEVIDGVPVHRLPIPPPKAVASVAFSATALALLRELKPDVLHAHGLLSPATTAVAAKRLFGTPIVVTVHDSGPIGELARIQHRAFHLRRVEMLRRNVDMFTVISRAVDRDLSAIGIPETRRQFLNNGVDAEQFKPVSSPEKTALRAQLGLGPGPIVNYTGRLVGFKQIQHLVQIWPEVQQQCPQASCLIIGAGPEEAALRRAASKGIRFIDPPEGVGPYMQASDIFVLPSAGEGMSVAVLEAMATGLPVVTTTVGGNLDVIEHGKNGWLVPPGDVEALKQAVLTLAADAETRRRLGERARETILRDYQIQEIARGLHRLYDQVIAMKNDRASLSATSPV